MPAFYQNTKFLANTVFHGDVEFCGNVEFHGAINKNKFIDDKLKDILISNGILTEEQLNNYIDSIKIMEKLTVK